MCRYRELAEKEEGVCFVGRLASYKYFNMDQVRARLAEPSARVRLVPLPTVPLPMRASALACLHRS